MNEDKLKRYYGYEAVEKFDEERLAKLQEHYKAILELLGEDPNREGLLKTPFRVAKSMQYLTHGYQLNPVEILLSAKFKEDYRQMVIVKDIEVYSLCEHHLIPFIGEEGKAFFENQSIKDYTAVCEMVLNDCGFAEKEAGLPYVISWVFRMPNGGCNPNYGGGCIVIRRKESSSLQSNAVGYFEDDKLIIIPTTEENGFTADGYLAIGAPIEVQYDSIVIKEGIYAAYYDEELGKYSAVAVDYYVIK